MVSGNELYLQHINNHHVRKYVYLQCYAFSAGTLSSLLLHEII